MFAYLEARLRRTAQASAFSIVGLVLLLVGLGFFLSAAWMTLSALRDPLFAALVLGAACFGLALILFAFSSMLMRRPPRVPRRSATSSPAIQLIEGFIVGLDAGRRSRSRKH